MITRSLVLIILKPSNVVEVGQAVASRLCRRNADLPLTHRRPLRSLGGVAWRDIRHII